MKTPILFLAVLFIMLGCKTKNEYSIHGSFTGEPTEEWIYLVKFMESNPEVDSAQIIDGTFEIKGMVDFPEVYGLSYHYTKATGICPLFLEPADLKVIIDWRFGNLIQLFLEE